MMPAAAADISPVPVYDWTGFYLGAQGGYGWGTNEYSFSTNAAKSINMSGIVGGGTAGYNFQADRIVFGLEGDFSLAGINGYYLAPPSIAGNPPCMNQGCSANVDWFGTGRVRLGYAVDNFMPYVTGGLAVGGARGTVDLGACGPGAGSCGFNNTQWGWTVGAGAEYGINKNWSAKVEYLYVNLGTPSFPNVNLASGIVDFSVVRVGVNYRF